VHFVDCTGNVVHSEGVPVVLYGVSGMLVVTLSGLTFVTTLDRATELRPLLESLPDELRNVQLKATSD
jgi:mannose-1-phosphate guanylyltransferase